MWQERGLPKICRAFLWFRSWSIADCRASCHEAKLHFLEREASFESWQDLIFNLRPNEVWSNTARDGLKFPVDQRGSRGGSIHLIAWLCERATDLEILRYYGEGAQKFVSFAVESFSDVMANYCALAYLTENLKGLKLSRSSLRLSKLNKSQQLNALEDIQKFFDQSLGAPLIAAELKKRASHSSNFFYRFGDYSAPGLGPKPESASLWQLATRPDARPRNLAQMEGFCRAPISSPVSP